MSESNGMAGAGRKDILWVWAAVGEGPPPVLESGVEFVAADMPFANKLTIHILGAVAEHEREAISARTKAALAAAKARGVKLGGPKLKQA